MMLAFLAVLVAALVLNVEGSTPAAFKTAKIIKNNVECVGIRSITIEVDDSIATAFTIPGSHSYLYPIIHTYSHVCAH